MKNIFILLLSLTTTFVSAQKYFTKTGLTDFKASVEAFEAVEATNNSTTAVLNSANGQFASLIFVKAFHFKVALMEEHFNENYMDSDKFPKATFKGNIENYNHDELKNEEIEYTISGTLTIKGVSKNIKTKATLCNLNNVVSIKANFSVKPQDFNIKIPGIVREKIAKEINIHLNYQLNEKK